MPYATMTLDAIRNLDVESQAHTDAHLYLWTTQKFLRDAYEVVEAWGFRPSATVLVWCKAPYGLGMGRLFGSATEFILFGWRGSPPPKGRPVVNRNWFDWPRAGHSAKPDAFYDLVEKASPGPYLELFARRARFGWDYWGDESLQTVELRAAEQA